MRHLIFDFFGTLVRYDDGIAAGGAERARSELAALGAGLDADAFTARWLAVFTDIDATAQRTLREFSMLDAARSLFADLGIAASGEGIERFVEAYLADWSTAVVPLPRLGPWLAALPMPKSILSNTHHEPLVLGLLDRFALRPAFGCVTTSVGHGYRKPHASVYRAHLAATGVEARDAIFVGDNPQCDYFGPRAVGIEAYLIAPRPVVGVPERYRLADLFQLSERLGD